MKNKLLYIGSRTEKIKSGADLVNKRNQELLESFFSVIYLPFVKGRFSKFYFSANDNYLKCIEEKLCSEKYEFVFIQQSLLGRVCQYIKKKHPQIKIIVFFHNIEIQYAREYIRTKGISAIPFYLSVLYWERKCCKNADYYITLNQRDSQLLHDVYARKSDLELPTSFHDSFDMRIASRTQASMENEPVDYLFIGVSFFANVQGIQWFINHVMPKVNGHLHVVGKGMDAIDFKNLTDRVHIHGFVDDLSGYYYRARMVVSPIHVGGGMKTKTAEALMYGKTILGSSEAFEGYEMDERCMILCNTEEDYIRTICNMTNDTPLYNAFARQLFTKYYSNNVVRFKMNFFFKSIANEE